MGSLAVMSVCVVLLAGCRQYPESECVKYAGGTREVSMRAPMDDSSNMAVPLANKQVLAGTFASPATMKISEVGVQIGNSGGAARGKVALKLCQDEACTIGRGDLAGSKDNDYLMIHLDSELPLRQSRGVVRYELAREEGDGNLVVWLYPALGKGTLVLDGKPEPRIMNLMMYQR